MPPASLSHTRGSRCAMRRPCTAHSPGRTPRPAAGGAGWAGRRWLASTCGCRGSRGVGSPRMRCAPERRGGGGTSCCSSAFLPPAVHANTTQPRHAGCRRPPPPFDPTPPTAPPVAGALVGRIVAAGAHVGGAPAEPGGHRAAVPGTGSTIMGWVGGWEGCTREPCRGTSTSPCEPLPGAVHHAACSNAHTCTCAPRTRCHVRGTCCRWPACCTPRTPARWRQRRPRRRRRPPLRRTGACRRTAAAGRRGAREQAGQARCAALAPAAALQQPGRRGTRDQRSRCRSGAQRRTGAGRRTAAAGARSTQVSRQGGQSSSANSTPARQPPASVHGTHLPPTYGRLHVWHW
jgi:hypothetical protein